MATNRQLGFVKRRGVLAINASSLFAGVGLPHRQVFQNFISSAHELIRDVHRLFHPMATLLNRRLRAGDRGVLTSANNHRAGRRDIIQMLLVLSVNETTTRPAAADHIGSIVIGRS